MKATIKIPLTLITLLIIVFIMAYLCLLFLGRFIIIKEFKDLTKRNVQIGHFTVTPPFNMQIKELNVEGLLKADSLTISPSIIGFLSGNIAFNYIKIVRPEFIYNRVPPEVVKTPDIQASSPTTFMPNKPNRSLRLIFKHLIVKDGRIDFFDHTVGPEAIRITVKDLNFKLNNLYVFPRSAISNFELKANIPRQKGQAEGKIEAEGWVNPFKKDMQATLKIKDIDGIYLYPYYSSWVDLDKARIEKATLSFSSNLQGLNNNVVAECHLELTDIVRRPLPPEESEEKAAKIANAVLGIFKTLDQGNISLNFTIRTKMDKPEFGFGNIKMAFEDKLAEGKKKGGIKAEDVILLPASVLQRMVKGVTDISKALIVGTGGVIKEIKNTTEDIILRKEHKTNTEEVKEENKETKK